MSGPWSVPRTLAQLVLVAALALGAVACQTVPPPLEGAASVPESWVLEGRLALSNGRDGGSGRLAWAHGPRSDSLRFHGALGAGAWRLEADARQAELSTGDGQRFRDRDTETLVRRQLGWDLPVAELSAWVLGVPFEGSAYAVRRDRGGRLELLEQGGWTIRYEGFLETSAGWLPRKLVARRAGDEVRLIVGRWRFPPGSEAN